MSPRTGRPVTGNARGKVLAVRLSDDEAALLASAVEKDPKSTSVSEYMRDAAISKAKRVK